MGDVWVHDKLRACCRKTLAELDEKKKTARVLKGLVAVGSLVTLLGESPVDLAITLVRDAASKTAADALSGSRTSVSDIENPAARASDVDILLRSTCAKICELHALDHTGTEARFWMEMADGFDGGSGKVARLAREEARAKAKEAATKKAEFERARAMGQEGVDEALNRSIEEEYRRIEAKEGTAAANRWSVEVMKRSRR